MKQIQITLPDHVLEAMRKESERLGITPNLLARLRLGEQFLGFRLDASEKAFTVRFKNWKEVEAYASVKCLGTEKFIIEAVGRDMRRNALKPAQKAELERILAK